MVGLEPTTAHLRNGQSVLSPLGTTHIRPGVHTCYVPYAVGSNRKDYEGITIAVGSAGGTGCFLLMAICDAAMP